MENHLQGKRNTKFIWLIGEIYWQECLRKPANDTDRSLPNDIKAGDLHLFTTTGNTHGKRKTPVSSCSWFPPLGVKSNAIHFPTHEAAGDLAQWNLQTESIGGNGHPCGVIVVSRSGTPSIFQRLCKGTVLSQLFLSVACLLMPFIKAFKALEQSCQRTINLCQAAK